MYWLDSNFQRFLTLCAWAESVNEIEWQHLTSFKQEQDETIQRKLRLELPPGLDPMVGGRVVVQNEIELENISNLGGRRGR